MNSQVKEHMLPLDIFGLVALLLWEIALSQSLADLWVGKRTLNKHLNYILKSLRDDDSTSCQLRWPKLSWRRRWHVTCVDFKAKREGEEEASIYLVSSLSRCCDTHITHGTYSVVGIIIMAPVGIGWGPWARTRTRWAGWRTKPCQRQCRCCSSGAKIRATSSTAWRWTQFHSSHISLK